jgi:Meiotically up-regulated gene 113
MTEHVYVYVIGRAAGPVKVGIASKPWQRIKELQTGCPFNLEILFVHPMLERESAIWCEQKFHKAYEEHRTYGEWFELEAKLAIEGIESILESDRHGELAGRILDTFTRCIIACGAYRCSWIDLISCVGKDLKVSPEVIEHEIAGNRKLAGERWGDGAR